MGFDGLENNVEFYSGGLQLWLGCRIQRIVMLDNPKVFSQHLICKCVLLLFWITQDSRLPYLSSHYLTFASNSSRRSYRE